MGGRAQLYFVLAGIGLLGQLGITAAFLADEGLDLAEFADQAVATTIAVLGLADLVMCGLVYLVWSRAEARRVGIEPWWPFALAVAGGVCFAFPLFLGYRELALRPAAQATGST